MYLEYREPLVLNQNPFMVFQDHPQLTNQVSSSSLYDYLELSHFRLIEQPILFGHLYGLNWPYKMVSCLLKYIIFSLRKSDVNWFKNVIR